MALFLGVATSFHVLVGVYATASVLGWMFLGGRNRIPSIREAFLCSLLFLLGGMFAIEPVLARFGGGLGSTGEVASSLVYVSLRNPHHLNPFSWSRLELLTEIGMVLLLVAGSLAITRLRGRRLQEARTADDRRKELGHFILVGLVPFALGLMVALLDSQGGWESDHRFRFAADWLQYYPFRFADGMTVLTTALVAGSTLQTVLSNRFGRVFAATSLVATSLFIADTVPRFTTNLRGLTELNGGLPGSSPDWSEVCLWIGKNTPKDGVVVTFPGRFIDFSWLAQRATVAKFKHVPNGKESILEWFERMQDLSGRAWPWEVAGLALVDYLDEGYVHLSSDEAESLMAKYDASFFLTTSDHPLRLPLAYENPTFSVYRRAESNPLSLEPQK
jgi:hypothetical protein